MAKGRTAEQRMIDAAKARVGDLAGIAIMREAVTQATTGEFRDFGKVRDLAKLAFSVLGTDAEYPEEFEALAREIEDVEGFEW